MSILDNKDLILGLWWLILVFESKVFALVVDFGSTELVLGLRGFILGVWKFILGFNDQISPSVCQIKALYFISDF